MRHDRVDQKKMLLLLWFALLFVLGACSPSQATTDDQICVTYCVDDVLLSFYVENGGRRIFGNATSTLLDAADREGDIKVQYFDNFRLDYNATTGEIEIFPLGRWAYETESAETFPIEGAFLEFYEDNHGVELFGDPISPQIIQGAYRVQYFENARLEWHPGAPLGFQVQVGQLGQAYCLHERARCNPVDAFVPETRPTHAEVTAAVGHPILYAGEEQTIFVMAQSIEGKVAGAVVELVIHHAGETFTQVLPEPLEELDSGREDMAIVQGVIDLPTLVTGEPIDVEVRVRFRDSEKPIGSTLISFQTWY